MIYKRCPHCKKRVAEGKKCECNYKRGYEKPTGTRRLYITTKWNKLRVVILSMYSGLDQWALANGRIEHATIVHHIIPAEEKPERFYDIDNLIPVSRTSHDEIHSLYRKSKKDKQRVQAMLRDKLKSLKI